MHINLSVPCQQVTVYTSDIKKAYAYLFYKKNVASQVLRMMHGRHLFFPFLKT